MRFAGKRTAPAGAWDTAIMLALEFHWTPDDIAALPADYYDELVIALNARSEHDAHERKKQRLRQPVSRRK